MMVQAHPAGDREQPSGKAPTRPVAKQVHVGPDKRLLQQILRRRGGAPGAAEIAAPGSGNRRSNSSKLAVEPCWARRASSSSLGEAVGELRGIPRSVVRVAPQPASAATLLLTLVLRISCFRLRPQLVGGRTPPGDHRLAGDVQRKGVQQLASSRDCWDRTAKWPCPVRLPRRA